LTTQPVQIVLASASPGRLATLRRAGIEPLVIVSGVDETDDEPDPAQLALNLAVRKADAVIARLEQTGSVDGRFEQVVLGCDSVLELDGVNYGKPEDADAAIERWQRMRGRTGVLHTGHCLVSPRTGHAVARVAGTKVTFAMVTDAEIAAYVATGEPLRVAGAFTLDGLGGPFVERVDGDPHNVVGLSLPLLRTMLADLGIAWPSLWSSSSRAG
jgi:septum formation protein